MKLVVAAPTAADSTPAELVTAPEHTRPKTPTNTPAPPTIQRSRCPTDRPSAKQSATWRDASRHRHPEEILRSPR